MTLFSFFLAIVLTILGLASSLPKLETFPTAAMILPLTPLQKASTFATIRAPKPPAPAPPAGTVVPWGTTEKLEEHLYRTYVGSDPKMGTPEEILAALNAYRKNHERGEVRSDERLCSFSQKRAEEQNKAGNLDKHKGLKEYLQDPAHWQELNITAIGENASFGYILSGVHLIEWVFDADEEHRSNQLSPQWNLACAGISGTVANILFARR